MKFGSAEYEIAQSLDASSLDARNIVTPPMYGRTENIFCILCREYLLYASFDSSESFGQVARQIYLSLGR